MFSVTLWPSSVALWLKSAMTLRELNRATLARQMLLARESARSSRPSSNLLGLQAQLPRPPFTGLWSRLEGLRPRGPGAATEQQAHRRARHVHARHDSPDDRRRLPEVPRPACSRRPRRRPARDSPGARGHDGHSDAAGRGARVLRAAAQLRGRARPPGLERFPAATSARWAMPRAWACRWCRCPARTPGAFPARGGFVSAETWLGKPVAAVQGRLTRSCCAIWRRTVRRPRRTRRHGSASRASTPVFASAWRRSS